MYTVHAFTFVVESETAVRIMFQEYIIIIITIIILSVVKCLLNLKF